MDSQKIAEMYDAFRALKDRQDILDCIVRECRGRDRHDAELISSCYWDEATIESGSRITATPDYAEAANRGHAGGFAATAHNITNHTCEIDGDVAYSEAYCVGGLLLKDSQRCHIVCSRYLDQLERRDGEWRIIMRRNSIEMSAEGPASFLHSGALAGFLKGSWSREDPSYHRPYGPQPTDRRW